MWSKGYAADETKAAFDRVQELAGGDEKAVERYVTHYAQLVGSMLRGELTAAKETAERMLREAGSEAQTPEAMVAHRALGLTCHCQGDFAGAQAHLERALRIDDRDWDRDTKFRFGHSGAVATAYLAHVSWHLGKITRARELMDGAVARAAALDHVQTTALVNSYKTLFEMLGGDYRAAQLSAESLIEFSREHSLKLFVALGELYARLARAQSGDQQVGVREVQHALTEFIDQGNRMYLPFFQGLTAEIESERESADAALGRIDDALTLAQQTGDRWTDAFLHRIRGEILLKRDRTNTAPAEEALLTAIAIAKEQKARSFELRAALDLARLWRSQGKPQQARELLAPVYGWFTEGFDTRDLKEAKALLDELASYVLYRQ